MEKRRRETRQLIGYVPHENDLDPWLTLEQNIRFTANLYRVDEETAIRRMAMFAEALNLVPYLNEFASRTSHGIQKKTMLVRELVHDPDVLILDEPTGYMDAESIRETWDLLKELKGHKTIIYVSNALAEIEQAHDRIMVFHEGRILMDGHLDKLLESTLDYHQFQIEFENLTDELFKKLTNVATIISPNKMDNIFHFYGRTRAVFFDVINAAADEIMIDLSVKKLGLRDLLDSEFAGRGLD
jgi:ABC-type multidrug transport system ATPase subunit